MDGVAVAGKHYLRALAYAHKCCPSDDATARIQHVVFVENKIVCSDGQRWHVGVLPDDFLVSTPIAVARESISELLLGLEYARRIAARHNSTFLVWMNETHVEIEYAKKTLVHELLKVDVGRIPSEWREPVPADAPALIGPQSEIRCGHMNEATKWYKAWDHDHGTMKFRGLGENHPLRIEVIAGGDLVAYAILLPVDRPPAQLRPDEPLFNQGGEAPGQSILDLDLEGIAPQLVDKPKRRKGKGNGKSIGEATGHALGAEGSPMPAPEESDTL